MDSQLTIPPGSVAQNVQYAAPTTGTSVTILAPTDVLLLDPAGTLLALTVVLPTGADGKKIKIGSSQAITTLTVTGTIVGTLAGMALAGFAEFIYSGAASKWFRTG